MGRALYSSRYTKAHQSQVQARQQQQALANPAQAEMDAPTAAPEPAVAVYEKWSPMNPFDPDSDDFFIDAEYEAFVDGEHPLPEPVVRVEIIPQRNVSPISSGSSSASEDGDREDSSSSSPMAVGADPATLLAGAYAPGEWERRFLLAGAGGAPPQPWLQMEQHLRPGSIRRPLRARASSLSFLPTSAPSPRPVAHQPAGGRSTYAGYADLFPPPPARPARPSSPGADEDVAPADDASPEPAPRAPSSPAPVAPPRLYTFDSRSGVPIARSPTVERRAPADRGTSSTPPSNPLPNPNARMSHSRISPRVPLRAM
ncbi:hypothetical protein HDZ31DRAFT_71998 [Schizophyllum fasciatum]